MPSATALAAATGLPEISYRESDDGYAGIVARLNAKWRVIRCKDDLQWIVQCLDGYRAGRARWKGESYLRSRDTLIRVCRAKAGEIDPIAFVTLHRLPAHFPEGAKS